jgi:hypothetical protein
MLTVHDTAHRLIHVPGGLAHAVIVHAAPHTHPGGRLAVLRNAQHHAQQQLLCSGTLHPVKGACEGAELRTLSLG